MTGNEVSGDGGEKSAVGQLQRTAGARTAGVTRAERRASIATLRAQSLTQGEIATRLGLSRSYISELENDPRGLDKRWRKYRAAATCAECGRVTSYAIGGGARRCQPCEAVDPLIRTWTPELVVAAFREYRARHGYWPGSQELSPAQARSQGLELIARRFEDDGCWPHTATVLAVCGSIREARVEAGGPRSVYRRRDADRAALAQVS